MVGMVQKKIISGKNTIEWWARERRQTPFCTSLYFLNTCKRLMCQRSVRNSSASSLPHHASPLLFVCFFLHWYYFQWRLPVSLCEASWLGYSYRVVSAMVELFTQEVAMSAFTVGVLSIKKIITLSFSILEKSLTAIFKDSETSSWTSCRSCKRQRKRL